MKKLPLIFTLFLSYGQSSAQTNVGIGTPSPGSNLTVNGSLAVGYNNVSGNYSLTNSDYYVVYSGSSSGFFNLPTALADGNGNFKGRTYKIKNASATNLTITAAGSEKIIGTSGVLIIDPGATAELISTGLTSGITWEVLNYTLAVTNYSDAILAAMATVGCASCAIYNTAGANLWINISRKEYDAILTHVAGAGAYGIPMNRLDSTTIAGLAPSVTYTQNVSHSTLLPASQIPIAMAIKTGPTAPANLVGMKLKISSTSLTTGYADLPVGVFSLPTGMIGNTVYCFVLKRPTYVTSAANPSYMAMHVPITNQVGMFSTTGSCYFASGDANTFSNLYGSALPAFQVLATPYKQW